MRMLILLAGLAMLLAGAAQAQQYVLVSARGADGAMIIRKIEVNYIDVGALVRALGGTTLDLYSYRTPQPATNAPGALPMNQPPVLAPAQQTIPNGPLPPAAAPTSNLNPNAPLAPLIPPGIMDIIGVR